MQIDDRKKEKDKLTKELNEVRTLLPFSEEETLLSTTRAEQMWSLSTTYGKALTDYKKECTRHKDKLGELTRTPTRLSESL